MKSTKMKKNIVISFILLVLGGVSFAIVKYQEEQARIMAEQKKIEEIIAEAEKAVKTAETEQSKHTVNSAYYLVGKVVDKKIRENFKQRLDTVRLLIAQKEQLDRTEKAVRNAEDKKTRGSVALAQVEVDEVAETDKKTSFQARLDAIINAINTREAAQAAEATRLAQEAEAARLAHEAEAARLAQEAAAESPSYSYGGQTYVQQQPSYTHVNPQPQFSAEETPTGNGDWRNIDGFIYIPDVIMDGPQN